MDPIATFWDAMRALTYAEMQEVAGTIRDAWLSCDYDMDDSVSVMALLNSGREIYDANEEADEQAQLAA